MKRRPAVLTLALVLACAVPLFAQREQRQAAIALEQQGDVAQAEAAWKALAAAYPSVAEPFAHLGLLEARQEHYDAAIGYYRKALALDPKMPGLRINLGLALFKAGDYPQSIALFEPILKAQPASPEAERLAILIGMSYYGLGNYKAAAPYLKEASQRDPDNLALLLALAHSCLYSTQYQCVLDTFHKMVELNAESAEADMLTGEALDEMKDPLGAMRQFRAAIAVNPKEPNAHFGLGYLLWTQGNTQEAVTEFEAELANDPGHAPAMLYLADAYIQLNRFGDAEPLLKKVVDDNSQNAMAHRDLGIVYSEEGKSEAALTELKKAAELNPDDVSAHWRMAKLYRSMGKAAEAKAEFDKASSLNKAADDKLLKVMSSAPAKDKTPQPAPKSVSP